MFKSFKNRINDLKFKLQITMSDPIIYKIYSEMITHGRQPLYPFTYYKINNVFEKYSTHGNHVHQI